MKKSIFELNRERLFESESFATATAEELRVLVAMLAGGATDDAELAALASVSAPRCRSAIALFEAEGIVTRADAVSDEFVPSDIGIGEVEEDNAVKVARDIRDSGLATLIAEFAALMNKPALSTGSVKKIVSLYTNYALSEEYILALAAHLADCGKLTVTRLVNEAMKLVEREIDTPEGLYAYIEQKQRRTDADQRIRNMLGLSNRTLSKTEHECFNRWVNEYGYSEGIIGEAYDICVAQLGKYSPKYMNAVLSRWHECGCKTLNECLAATERDRATIRAEKTAKRKGGTKNSEQSAEPKYAAFSAEDALMRALERSYGGDADDLQ